MVSKVGSSGKVGVGENLYDNALNATRTSIEEGILLGFMLLKLSPMLNFDAANNERCADVLCMDNL